jgi:hypothetical protein
MTKHLFYALLFCILIYPTPTPEQLRCAYPGVENWREVMEQGEVIEVRDYPIDGRQRKTILFSFHTRAFIFIFMWPELPGAREAGAWHGCAVYDLGRITRRHS